MSQPEKNKRILGVLICVALAILGEQFIPENPYLGKKNIRLVIENTYTYGLVYIPIPLLFAERFKRNFYLNLLFFPAGIFLISYLYRVKNSEEFIGILYIFTYLVIAKIRKECKEKLISLGLTLDRAGESLFLGIFFSILLSAHLVFTVTLTSYTYFAMMPLKKFFYWTFFEIGIDALGEEMFYRGFLFGELNRYFKFWGATFLSTFFYILVYLAKPYAFLNPVLTVCVIFYHLLQGIFSCFIFNRTGNIFGCIFLNVVFSMVANSLVLP